MIEVYAHNYLKQLLKKDSFIWPHNLTLSRLVARSLRRRDKTLVQLEINDHNDYWPGLLIPLCLNIREVVLVVNLTQKRRLFEIEIPRLRDEGLNLAVWEGAEPPINGQIWVLDHRDLINAYRKNYLSSKQLIIPQGDLFSSQLRDALSIEIYSSNWDSLRRSFPSLSSGLINLHERLSRRLFSQSIRADSAVRMDSKDIVEMKDLLGAISLPPKPWNIVMETTSLGWASWAQLDHKLLDWCWHLQPLEPLQTLRQLFLDNPFIILNGSLHNDFQSLEDVVNVTVKLGGPIHQEPINLFVPFRQPLPNAECFAEHLLDQSRRLILGRQGVTILVLDDHRLLRKLTTELAAEFGKRVVFETTAPETNGVVCCSSRWWIASSEKLPPPEQLIVALLPISSLESPLTAARVEAFKQKGLDWFRDLLLPDLLAFIPRLVLPVRKNHGRVAILDGRLRSRVWGQKVFDVLEPWIPLERLLPD